MNAILVHAYKNTKPISFAWPNNWCEWKMSSKVKLKTFIYIQEKAICKCKCIDLCNVEKYIGGILHWQVSLYKFIRLAGDLLPPSLYVPYIDMLIGLSSNPQSAHYCFDLLKINGMGSGRYLIMDQLWHMKVSRRILYTRLTVLIKMPWHDSACRYLYLEKKEQRLMDFI